MTQSIFSTFSLNIINPFALSKEKFIVTARQRSCGKVMLSVVSVYIQRGVPVQSFDALSLQDLPPLHRVPAPPRHVQTCSTWISLDSVSPERTVLQKL